MTTEAVIRVLPTSEGMPATTRNWKRQGTNSPLESVLDHGPAHLSMKLSEILASRTMRIM